MSLEASKAVWKMSKSRLASRIVLLAIADHTNDKGHSWPSITTLREMTGLSERTVQGALKDLVELKEISIRANGGRNGVNFYTMELAIPVQILPPQSLRPADSAPPRNPQQEPPQSTTDSSPAKFAPKPEPLRTTKGEIVFPVELDNPPFRAGWEAWGQYRRERKLSAYTPSGTNMQFAKLKKLGAARAIAAIEHSIAQNYQGIYEDKNHAKTNSGSAPTSPHNNNLNRDAVSDYRQIRKRVPVGMDANGQGNATGGGGASGHVS
jgi:hypothetical protein